MTVQEFSNEFDILYDNIMSNVAAPLNEYEKSVFLTKAQEEIVYNYFNPKGNKYQEGFDSSSKRQWDFSSITEVSRMTVLPDTITSYVPIDSRSKLYYFPDVTIISILNESFEYPASDDTSVPKYPVQIIPISYESYLREMSKPYKYPKKNQAWRILNNFSYSTTKNGVSTTTLYKIAEIITPYTIREDSYVIRYVRKPKPIILVALSNYGNDIKIDGINTVTDCELSPEIHREILQRAVELAKNAYIGDLNTTVQLGQRSE